jgi:hypothetical protein
MDKSKLPPGAVIIIVGSTSLEDLENTLSQQQGSATQLGQGTLSGLTYKIMIETENGEMLAFNPVEDYTKLIDYTGGDVISYIKDLESTQEGIYLTEEEYNNMYVQSEDWIEVPQNFFQTKIGTLTTEEAALMADTDFTIADQIDIAMNSFNTMYEGTTKFKSPTYRKKWQEGYLLFQDIESANAYVSTSKVMNQVLKELGKTADEITATDYYATNEAQYALDLSAQKGYLYDLLPSGASVDDKTMEWIANKVVMGSWDANKARSQLFRLVDKYRDTPLDKGLESFITNSTIEQTTVGEKEIMSLLDDYAPPSVKKDYIDEIEKHAGEYRQDASYLETLEQELKDTRYALYPQYDRDTKWSVIDRLTKNTIKNKWDMEIDPNGKYGYVYNKVAALNDVNEANKYLVQEGLANNIGGVVQDFAKDMISAFGGNIVRSQNFLEPSTQRIR